MEAVLRDLDTFCNNFFSSFEFLGVFFDILIVATCLLEMM
jgi:hypothetical protein